MFMLKTKATEGPSCGTNEQEIVSHSRDTRINQHPLSPHIPVPWATPVLNPATQGHTHILLWAHIFPSSTSDGISTIQRAKGRCNATGRLGRPGCRLQKAMSLPAQASACRCLTQLLWEARGHFHEPALCF